MLCYTYTKINKVTKIKMQNLTQREKILLAIVLPAKEKKLKKVKK